MKTLICPLCGREFKNQPDHGKVMPHRCNGNFRKSFYAEIEPDMMLEMSNKDFKIHKG